MVRVKGGVVQEENLGAGVMMHNATLLWMKQVSGKIRLVDFFPMV